jgi:acyl carrier protein
LKTREEIRSAVLAGIAKVTNRSEVVLADHESFQHFGLDSVDRMSLLMEVEDLLGATFGDQIGPERLKCISDYIDYIQQPDSESKTADAPHA